MLLVMLRWILAFFWYIAAGSATGFYIDATSGRDANPGTSPSRAWASLARINATTFQPGDRILLRAGSAWTGQLWPKGSGAAGRPITVDRYGHGKNPVIHGAGIVEDAVRLYNQEFWEIRNIEVTNTGTIPGFRRGIHLVLENYGTARNVLVSHVEVHDVNGSLDAKDTGGIIWSIHGAKQPSRFDGLTIEHSCVHNVDRTGIAGQSSHWMRTFWFPSLHVRIRHNTVEDIGGDGIVPWACDGLLVEFNVAKGCNQRSQGFNAGIWAWSCDNSVFQYNEAYMMRGTRDGEGFDSDYNSRNAIFQHNYAHDNEGGFMLICNDGGHGSDINAGNVGTIVRNNLSQDDAIRSFHVAGPVRGARIYGNEIYSDTGKEVNLVQISDWKGWPEDMEFTRNRFGVSGSARCGYAIGRTSDGLFKIAPGMGLALRTQFLRNVFGATSTDCPTDDARDGNGRLGLTGAPLEEFARKSIGLRSAEQRHTAWKRFLQLKFGN
jgi:hypothetical protein